MPSGPCPASWDGELNLSGVRVLYHVTWDGVSVRTGPNGCFGTLNTLAVVNTTGVTMYAHFVGKRGTPRTVSIAPGFDNRANPLTQPQLGNQGFNDSTDLEGLRITNSPADPA